MLEIVLIIALVITIAGWLGWFQRGTTTVITSLPEPKSRCRTITYYYDDGFAKTYHSCQGHLEFTDRCGRRLAPKGARLIKSVGGVHV